jgi:hypothetical protein
MSSGDQPSRQGSSHETRRAGHGVGGRAPSGRQDRIPYRRGDSDAVPFDDTWAAAEVGRAIMLIRRGTGVEVRYGAIRVRFPRRTWP